MRIAKTRGVLNLPLENAGFSAPCIGNPVIRDHPVKNFKLPPLSARNSRTKTASCRHYPNAKRCNALRQNSGEIEGAVALRALHRSGLISEGGSSCTWDEQRGRKRASKIAYKLHSQFSWGSAGWPALRAAKQALSSVSGNEGGRAKRVRRRRNGGSARGRRGRQVDEWTIKSQRRQLHRSIPCPMMLI